MSLIARTWLWLGASGVRYCYEVHPMPRGITRAWNSASPGNYIVARDVGYGAWQPIYIGQTTDLGGCFDDHHTHPCIELKGATHLHVHTNASVHARINEETDLIIHWNPICNG